MITFFLLNLLHSKDFLEFEELPVALYPDMSYDNGGCWSGTAIVKDDMLYLFYASIYTPEGTEERIQQISVACSKDGINFEKYEKFNFALNEFSHNKDNEWLFEKYEFLNKEIIF